MAEMERVDPIGRYLAGNTIPPSFDWVMQHDRSMRRLGELHNAYAHSGRPLFIIGSGPSLLDIPRPLLSQLAGHHTLGVNLLLLWQGLPFTPTYYAIQEMHTWGEDSIEEPLQRLLDGPLPLPVPDQCFYFHTHPLPYNPLHSWVWIYQDLSARMQDGIFHGLDPQFPLIGASFGNSVTMAAVQLGAWIGYDPIVLLGCDATVRGHAYTTPGRDPQRERQDSYHRSALTALNALKTAGRTLLDATGPKGQLGLPTEHRISLSQLLNGGE